MAPENKKELLIKNMVCPRCIMAVQKVLEDLGFTVYHVELGRVAVDESTAVPTKKIDEQLKKYGFELVKGKNQQMIEQIKTALIHYVQELETLEESPKLSEYLTRKLHQNYSSLSTAFSESEETTIEKYLIHLKIEHVKEWLSYGELTLSEIAYKLNYSSVAYLSSQFKKITDLSVTDYKKARDSFRKPLDDVG